MALLRAGHRDRRRCAGRRSSRRSASSSPRTASTSLALAAPGGLPGGDRARAACSTSSLVVAVAAAFSAKIHEQLGTGDTEPAAGSCVTEPLDHRRAWRCPLAAAAGALLARTPRQADAVNVAARAGHRRRWRSALAIARSRARQRRARGGWYVLDAARRRVPRRDRRRRAAQRARVARASSPAPGAAGSRARARAALLLRRVPLVLGGAARVPLVDNLAIAWLLIEATTGASALLVAFSGRRSALEAGWKYLVLTTLGLAVALLGHRRALRARAGTAGAPRRRWTGTRSPPPRRGCPQDAALLAFVLILAGLATKVGWAPVHNWLPDAHSEAPPPVSALLSAALLPTVVLVAWRVLATLAAGADAAARAAPVPRLRAGVAGVAVPFLWRAAAVEAAAGLLEPGAHGRARARHRLRRPLATAGVVVHVAGPRARQVARVLRGHAAAAPRSQTRAAGAARASPRASRGVRDRGRRQPRRARRRCRRRRCSSASC